MSLFTLVKYSILFSLGSILVLLATYNTTPVELFVPFSKYHLTLPAYLLILIMLLIGVLLGGFISLIIRSHYFKEIRALRKRTSALENEISALKIDNELINGTIIEAKALK